MTRRPVRADPPSPPPPAESAVRWAAILLPFAGAAAALGSGDVRPLWASLAAEPILIGVLAFLSRKRTEAERAWFETVLRHIDDGPIPEPPHPHLRAALGSILDIRRRLQARGDGDLGSGVDVLESSSFNARTLPDLTRSGLYESPMSESGTGNSSGFDAQMSGEFNAVDREMILRLSPESLAVLDASPTAIDYFERPYDRLRGVGFLDLVHADHRDLARDQLRGAVIHGEAHGLIYRLDAFEGPSRAVQMNVGGRYGPDGRLNYLRCHLTDITAKLRADRELRRRTKELAKANADLLRVNHELAELKDRYGDLYRNAPAMYFSLDEKGRIVECNDTLMRNLGYKREALIGRSLADFLAEPNHTAFRENYAKFLEQGRIEIESRFVKADGSIIDVWVRSSAVRAADGRFLHSRSIAQDITARKTLEAQLTEKNARLAKANEELVRKNKELDEFTYVVSHDLQEPLRTLIAFSDFLEKDCGDKLNEQEREYLGHIVQAARRMRSLIGDLLDLSRAGRVMREASAVNLDDVMARVTTDLGDMIRRRGAAIRVAGPLPTVWGDEMRLGQLFLNLTANGLKYNRSAHPQVVVELVSEQPTAVTIAVRDNGIGIEPKFHDKIFEMFRRLHARDEFEGTGAGLAICRKIVQAHGGTVAVESRAGEGASFLVTLPRPPAPAG